MSAARPISTPVILLALTAVAALGFWNGFRDSFYASGGIKGCTTGSAITGPGGAPVPLAVPMTGQPIPPADEIKPPASDAPKKKAPDTPKVADPGTETHDLAPLPTDKPAATASPKPPKAPKPAKPADAGPTTPPASKPPPAPGPEEPPY
ncbi:MAG: hypothetical protein JWP35_349 [Caulobacter sp.]|nr:hypothetical protein [Caulobacter sp.]